MNLLKSKRKVSLVLGSGGARGLVQIGVIKELVRKGYIIDEIVGCSIGSIIGAAYAQGCLEEVEKWMMSVTKMQVFRLMDFANPKFGLLKGAKVFESLKSVMPDVPIENLPLRYVAVATDLKGESEVIFDRGSVYEAIRASISIPAVFMGVDLEGKYLVDGGVLNPLPINHVKKKRRNIIIAVNLDGRPNPAYGPVSGADKGWSSVSVLTEVYFMMRRRLARLSVDLYRPDYEIQVPHNICGLWDYHRADDLIKKGTELVADCIPDIR